MNITALLINYIYKRMSFAIFLNFRQFLYCHNADFKITQLKRGNKFFKTS